MRARRIVFGLLVAVLLLEVIALGAVLVLTRTNWGMERVRAFGQNLVNARIPGSVRIERIDGPGLLGGVRLHGIAIDDPEGRPILRADSMRASYDWRTFLQRRIVLSNIIIWTPVIHITREPGESAWGIQRTFVATADEEPAEGGPGTVVDLRDVRIVGGHVIVREAVDTVVGLPWVVEDVPAGRVRVLEFTDFDAGIDRIAVNADELPGVYVTIRELDVHARVLQTAFDVIAARGRVALVDSTLSVEMPEVRLPASRAAVRGSVTLGAEGTRLDLAVTNAEVALHDLRWVDERIPERGTFTGALTVISEQEGLALRASDATLAIDGSRISGEAGIVLVEPMRVRQVALDLAPLDLALIDEYVALDLPVEGTLRGRVAADGPLASLRTRGELRARPRGAASDADIRWNGTIGLTDDPLLRDLALDVRGLEARALEDLTGADLRGVFEASVVADGRLRRGTRVSGMLIHRLPEGLVSSAEVEGEVRAGGDATAMDLEVLFVPLRLESVAPLADALAGLSGEVGGSATLRGTTRDLTVDADLRSAAGGVVADGRIRRDGALAWAGTLTLDRFAPAVHLARLPDVGATGILTFDLVGTDPARFSGSLTAQLDSARFQDLRVGPFFTDTRFDDGLLHVDTLILDAPGIVVRADGEFGLTPERSGRLTASVSSNSLQPLEPYVFEGEADDPTRPRLDGRGTAEARLEGSLAAFDVSAHLDLPELRIQDDRVHALVADLRGMGVRTDSAAWDGTARVDSLFLLGHAADSATVSAELRDGAVRFAVFAADSGRDRIDVAGVGTRTDGVLEARLQRLRLGHAATSWRLDGEAVVSMDGPVVTVDGLRLEREVGDGFFEASGHIVRMTETADTIRRPLQFVARLAEVPLDELTALAGYRLESTGTVEGELSLTGTPAAPIIDGEVGIREFRLGEAQLDSLGARVDYADRDMRLDLQAFRDGRRVLLGEGRIPIDLRLGATGERRLAENLDFSVQADSMPARFVLGFIDAVQDVEGTLDGQVSGRGTARDPQLSGALVLRQGAMTVPAIGVHYRGLIGTFAFERDMVVAVDLSGRSSAARARGDLTGSLRVTGEVDLEDPANPAFDLEVQAQRLLAANRRDVRAIVSGRAAVRGRYRAPEVSGDIRVDEGTINVDELYRQYLVVGLEDPLLFDMVDTTLVSVRRVMPATENPFLRNLSVRDFNVTVAQEAWLRSREMNVELAGDLNVIFDRVAEDLRLSGTLRTVRGTYRLDYPPFARVFEVQEGTVEFTGTPGVNPNLSVRALYRVRAQAEPLDIYAVVTGTLESPRVQLESDADPPISESDLASYLFFGVPTYAINFGGGAGPGGGVLTNIGSLAAPTLYGYVGAGLQTLAQSIGVLDYVGFTAAEATAGNQQGAGLGNLVQNAQIELGRYITPRTFVVWTQRVGTPDPSWDVRLEWRLNRGFTAEIFAEDRFARTPSFGLSQIANSRVYGFLLYREWGY